MIEQPKESGADRERKTAAAVTAVMALAGSERVASLVETAREMDKEERRRPQPPRGRDWRGFMARRSTRHRGR